MAHITEVDLTSDMAEFPAGLWFDLLTPLCWLPFLHLVADRVGYWYLVHVICRGLRYQRESIFLLRFGKKQRLICPSLGLVLFILRTITMGGHGREWAGTVRAERRWKPLGRPRSYFPPHHYHMGLEKFMGRGRAGPQMERTVGSKALQCLYSHPLYLSTLILSSTGVPVS